MEQTIQKAATPARGGKFRKILLGVGVFAVAGVAMSAAPAMARERGDDRGRVVERREFREREFREREFRHDRDEHRVIIDRDDCDRVWVPAQYELRTYFDCGRPVTERVCVEAGHWIIR